MKVVEAYKLDVREELKRGRDPFSRIMQAVAGLAPGQSLLLTAPFEPTPLYAVLGARGFGHTSRQLDSGDWEILFSEETSSTPGQPIDVRPPANPTLDVDARGLEPPEPLMKIMEAVTAAPPGEEVRARTDRKPVKLYEHLQERGWKSESEQLEDGSYLTRIRRS